jgi:hypothetical protein
MNRASLEEEARKSIRILSDSGEPMSEWKLRIFEVIREDADEATPDAMIMEIVTKAIEQFEMGVLPVQRKTGHPFAPLFLWLFDQHHLSDAAKLVYALLTQQLRPQPDGRLGARLSEERIAERLNRTARRVREILDELREARLLVTERQGPRTAISFLYVPTTAKTIDAARAWKSSAQASGQGVP